MNGSGKSTLVKILAGFHDPDEGGELHFNGDLVALPLRPGDYRSLGMTFVHQNLGLVPSLTVLENLRLVELTSGSDLFINWRKEEAAARKALERFGLDLDPRRARRQDHAGAARDAGDCARLRGNRARACRDR